MRFSGNVAIARDHPTLQFDSASNRVHNACELNEYAVAGSLDDPPVMRSDCRVDQLAPQRSKMRNGALLICTH